MVWLKAFLTGLAVLVMMSIIKKAIDPTVDTPAYITIGFIVLFANIAVFAGALMIIWSLWLYHHILGKLYEHDYEHR